MGIVVYKGDSKPKDSWIRYFKTRIMDKNQNNLIAVVGATGSGKTYAALSIGEKLAKALDKDFSCKNVVFTLHELMALINSGKLKKGSTIVFDEPQVSISSREFQSKANKIFNYLLSTFRHRNYTMLFCTPYEDLLDKSTRKLFHAKFLMQSINEKENISIVRPYTIEYNSKLMKFYEKFLKVSFKPSNKNTRTTIKLKKWIIQKPSEKLIIDYERKKRAFTTKLNIEIEQSLNEFAISGKKTKETKKELTDRQKEVLLSVFKNDGDKNKAANDIGIKKRVLYFHLKAAERKGWTPDEYYLSYSKNLN